MFGLRNCLVTMTHTATGGGPLPVEDQNSTHRGHPAHSAARFRILDDSDKFSQFRHIYTIIDDYWQQLLTILDKTSSPSRPQGVQLPNALGQSQETIFLKSLIIIRIQPGKVCPSMAIPGDNFLKKFDNHQDQTREGLSKQNNMKLQDVSCLFVLKWGPMSSCCFLPE